MDSTESFFERNLRIASVNLIDGTGKDVGGKNQIKYKANIKLRKRKEIEKSLSKSKMMNEAILR